MRVRVLEDQHGYILAHKVMERETDSDIAVEMVKTAKAAFPDLRGCSFDKGFWSSDNFSRLSADLNLVVLPKKGRLSQADKERESAAEFVAARRRHAAVESGINALENHGLDRCPDRGLGGFKRYVALAVLGRNPRKLGDALQKKELERQKRSQAIKDGLARKRAA
ncbi:MAG: hypothetical protein EOM74_01515 [Methanomicrobia archaeon]|nr:hypothetical protein [Methanomicrobia archaeon]